MTEEQIIEDWFTNKSNTDKIPTIVYTQPICNFIKATAAARYVNGEMFYNVFGVWQKIKYAETLTQ